MTTRSLGSWISRGTISVDEGFFEEVVSEANVLERGRKRVEDCVGEPEEENAGCEGERVVEVSDAADCDRPYMGTIRFCMIWVDAWAEPDDSGRVKSSCGISSAAGMGRPLPAATN